MEAISAKELAAAERQYERALETYHRSAAYRAFDLVRTEKAKEALHASEAHCVFEKAVIRFFIRLRVIKSSQDSSAERTLNPTA